VTNPVPADDTSSDGATAPGRDVRAKLLDAVERMAGDDYKLPRLAFSLREIAREVGIATPSIYRHFASKEDLISAAVDTGFTLLLRELDQAVQECADQEPPAVLRAQAAAYCRFLYRRRGLTRIMFATHPANWQPSEPLPDHLGQLRYRWITAVEACQKQGWRVPAEVTTTADAVWAAVHGCLTLTLVARNGSEESLLSHVSAQFDLWSTDRDTTTAAHHTANGRP